MSGSPKHSGEARLLDNAPSQRDERTLFSQFPAIFLSSDFSKDLDGNKSSAIASKVQAQHCAQLIDRFGFNCAIGRMT
jgi:hypothetical protein